MQERHAAAGNPQTAPSSPTGQQLDSGPRPALLGCLNGKLVPQAGLAVSVDDGGFVFGATVVDACRTYAHRLFRWSDHLERLRHDCSACQIPLPYCDAELTTLAEQLVAHNAAQFPPTQELTLITCVTPGPVGHYRPTTEAMPDRPGTLLMHTYPLPYTRYRRFFTEGVRLRIAGSLPFIPGGLVDRRVKHRSRLHWWLASQAVHADYPREHAVPLLCDSPDGCLTDTPIGAFLLVCSGVVCCPPAERILDSISLRITRELCQKLGIPFREGVLTLAEVTAAEEAFLAGTSFGIAGVAQIDGHRLPWPGPLTRQLITAWNGLAGLDGVAQMLAGSDCEER